VRKGTKQQITLTIAPDLLAKVDEMAERMGQSRAALINLAIYRVVEGGV
jgi:predicted transcriptional regulator